MPVLLLRSQVFIRMSSLPVITCLTTRCRLLIRGNVSYLNLTAIANLQLTGSRLFNTVIISYYYKSLYLWRCPEWIQLSFWHVVLFSLYYYPPDLRSRFFHWNDSVICVGSIYLLGHICFNYVALLISAQRWSTFVETLFAVRACKSGFLKLRYDLSLLLTPLLIIKRCEYARMFVTAALDRPVIANPVI